MLFLKSSGFDLVNFHTMLFFKCIRLPVRYSIPYSIFSERLLFSASNLFNATPTTTQRTEAEKGYRQRRHIAMTQFLLDECGLSEFQVSDLVSRHAKMFKSKSTHTAQQAVQFFRDSGFTEDQVRKIFLTQPTVLDLKVDTQLKPKIDSMKELGFTSSNLGHFLSRRPGLLGINLERNLSPKISMLVNLFGSKLNLCKALMRFPSMLECKVENVKPNVDILKQSGIQDGLFLYAINLRPNLILHNSQESLKSKIEYVQNLGILEGSKAFAITLASVDSSGLENFENKLKQMAKLGLLENEIKQLVMRGPSALSIGIDKIKKNMDFLKHTAGFQPNIVVVYPRLLTYSIENRMQPRHKVFEFLRETEPSRLPTNLAPVYQLGHQSFSDKFLVGSPEATKLFEKYKGKSVDLAIS